jgi:hypothetical protein
VHEAPVLRGVWRRVGPLGVFVRTLSLQFLQKADSTTWTRDLLVTRRQLLPLRQGFPSYKLNKYIHLILIQIFNINYLLFIIYCSKTPSGTLRYNFRITAEPFRFSLVNTLIIMNIPKPSLSTIKPLSVLPYGSGTL